MGDFGRQLSFKRDVYLENKGETCDGTDFKMGVAATLPELSEWTLLGSATSRTRKRKSLSQITLDRLDQSLMKKKSIRGIRH